MAAPQGLREFDDTEATRSNIYENVLSSVSKRFPIEDDNVKLELLNPHYDGAQSFSLEQQKQAILKNRQLRTNLVGTWRLTDKKTGKVLEEREDSVIQVPYYTDRGTIINNGNEYTVISQSRLKPGAYSRKKKNGELETQFNIKPGTGHGFRFGFNQEKGLFTLSTGQANIPLYPILKGIGITDKEIVKAWGPEITALNAEKTDPLALRKVYEKLAGYKADKSASDEVRARYIKDAFLKSEVDPDVIQRTMGLTNVKTVTPALMLRASQKLLGISRDEERSDDRDSPRFMDYYSVEDFLQERIEKDAGKLTKSMLWRAGRDRSLRRIHRNALNPYFDSFLSGTGLAMPGEEANPLSTLEQQSRITKFGQGGIRSADAVTEEARQVQGDYLGFVDPIAGPESERIGVDVRAAWKTYKGKDHKLYSEFINARTGKPEFVDIATASDRKVAFPGQDLSKPYVYIMKDGAPARCPTKDVDYVVPSFAKMFGSNTNMNPMPTAVQAGRQFYGSKFWTQYLPQVKGEVPLVDSLMPDGSQTFSEYYGRKVGTISSKIEGTVVSVDENSIVVKDAQGKKHTTELVKNLPFNRLSGISYFPSVEVGQTVKAGQMLAHSNFTDKKTGAINMGQNLKVCIMADGNEFEDSHCISESAAKRLATERLVGFEQDEKNGVVINRNKYMAAFPQKFTKEQFETLDENGAVKVGTIVKKGDPLIVSLGPKLLRAEDATLGKLSKALRNSFTDRSETWEHDWPGKVVDVVQTPTGIKCNVVYSPPVQPADKLSGRFGLKGVVNRIVPDDEMPRDPVTNEPYDMIVNPMGFLSRVAPGQLMEIYLGKVAKKTGKQVRIPQLPPEEGWYSWVQKQVSDAGLPDSVDIFDPKSGKTISGIGDGYMFVSAFHHLAEKKFSARGNEGGYTQDDQPAKGGSEGAKRISGLDATALLSHGATAVLKDSLTIRGTKNEEYWNRLRLGLPLTEPGVPFIYNKFLNSLRAGGINVVEKGNLTNILPMTDSDIEKMSNGRTIENSQMLDAELNPQKGGLFDPGKTGGAGGSQWAQIKLPEPIPNPIMEEPVRRVLGLTVKQLEKVLSGEDKLGGKTGGAAIVDALSAVNPEKMIEQCRSDIKTKRGASRDNAIKVLGYLTSMQKQGLSPKDWMITKVPVIPPKFRPVSKMGEVALVSDMNALYKDILETSQNFTELHKDLPDSDTTDERLGIYRSVKAAFGLGEPITPEGQAKGIKGAIRQVIGPVPKMGMFQREVISKTMDNVGRGAVTPDQNLDMDQVGIPEDAAWKMYRPFVMRELVKRGYPPVQAIKMLDDRDKTASDMLNQVMEKRPILMDRAPTWHKFNIMAFRPHRVDGKTIRVCPLVVSGFNMDFDGDEQIGSVFISCKINTLRDILENSKNSSLQTLKPLLEFFSSTTQGEPQMFTNTKTLVKNDNVIVPIDLEDFPHGELTNVRKDDKYDIEFYSVPEGIQVVSYDEKTGETVLADVKYWSIHRGKEVEIVNLSNGDQIYSDDDPRAVYGIGLDNTSLVPTRCTPTEALNNHMVVPVSNEIPEAVSAPLFYDFMKNDFVSEGGVPVDYNFGQFIGMMAGDGWVDVQGVKPYISDNEWFNANFGLSYLRSVFGQQVGMTSREFKKSELKGRYGDTTKHNYTGIENVTAFCESLKSLIGGSGDEHTSGSANKRLPLWFRSAGKDCLKGFVNGLIATDGSISVSNAKKKPQLMISFASTSIRLAREFRECCRLLGVKAGLTHSKKTTAGNDAWIVNVSTVDAKRIGLFDACCHTRKRETFVQTSVSADTAKLKGDIVPMPKALYDLFMTVVVSPKVSSLYKSKFKGTEEEWEHRLYLSSIAMNLRGHEKKGWITRSLAYQIDSEYGEKLKDHELYTKFMKIVKAPVQWAFVESIEKTGSVQQGYDLTVPGYETFMNTDGVILSNTVNMHVPVSDKAVEQAYAKMLPSKNLTETTDLKSARHPPSKEQIIGLYNLTQPANNKPVRRFRSVAEAKQAYQSGQIGMNDPIEIG